MLPFVLTLFAFPALAMHHHFHAQVIAIGGDVPTAGAVALAPAGGDVNAAVEHYDANGIRFDQAVSSVCGTDDGRVAVTTSVVTLRNIDILGRVSIDEIGFRFTGRQTHGAAEADITIDNLRLRNLIVDGRRVPLVLDATRLNKVRTFAAMRDGGNDEAFISSTLAVGDDQTLEVPGIGTLYFAEVVVKPGERSVTMLRIAFEPQHHLHQVSLGSGTTNGTDMLP
jgi:hypothetical protein